MKFLNGSDLAGFIKQRQAQQVRALRQAHKIVPHLAVILTNDHPASVKYVQMKQQYAQDIGAEAFIDHVLAANAREVIKKHNADPNIHGILVQLPVNDPTKTDEVLSAVNPQKDVDGLNSTQFFDSATPTAILWLLAGYNIDLKNKKVVVIGQGRLVGAPLTKILQASGVNVVAADKTTNLAEVCKDADVIISGTGQPGLLNSELIPKNAVVVDAGTASEGGKLVGDVAADVLENRTDLTITPKIGGVGPLTVCALFDNVIRAAIGQNKSIR